MKLSAKQTEVRGVRRLAIVAACAVFGVATCGAVMGLSMNVNAQAANDSGGPTKTPKIIHVSAGEMQGDVLNKVPPKYPAEAKKKKVQGTVVLRAVIAKDGTVKDLKAVSGPKLLRQSSMDAVKQWTYKPYLLNGNPIEVDTTINVIYSLGGSLTTPPPPPPPPSNE